MRSVSSLFLYLLLTFKIFNCALFQVAPKGNWMHIRYQSALSARQALSKNGIVFDNSLQLGVVPCMDKVSFYFPINSPFYLLCFAGRTLFKPFRLRLFQGSKINIQVAFIIKAVYLYFHYENNFKN